MEDKTRDEGLAEAQRIDQLKLNKINYNRFKEEDQRGFDILTNDQVHIGTKTNIAQPINVWTKAIAGTDHEKLTEEQKQMLQEMEEVKKQRDMKNIREQHS